MKVWPYILVHLGHFGGKFALTVKLLSTKRREKKSSIELFELVCVCVCVKLNFSACLLALWTNSSMNCLFIHCLPPPLFFPLVWISDCEIVTDSEGNEYKMADFEWLIWILSFKMGHLQLRRQSWFLTEAWVFGFGLSLFFPPSLLAVRAVIIPSCAEPGN